MTRDQSSGSLEGVMRSLNLDVEELEHDISSMAYPQLAEVKTKIEAYLDKLFSLLQDVYKFDMLLPLTRDGFPRNDIDVVSIRLVRTKIIRLRNDHLRVMERIGSLLSEQLSAGPVPAASKEKNVTGTDPFSKIPFALVRTVAPSSPAEKAGLQVGDKITLLDKNINVTNHQSLTEIAKRVKAKEGLQMEVVVLRGTSLVTLALVPTSNWDGRGLLGCHIVPV